MDPDLADAPSSPVAPRSSLHKSIVYRALYRWTRKGPDRGKWEIEITAEADAPLQAVSDVVRGVHRRAGEDAEPERLGPDELKVALSDTPWTVAATT